MQTNSSRASDLASFPPPSPIPAESHSGWYERCVSWAESPLSQVAISSGLGTFAIGGIAALLQRGFKMAARQPFYANHRAMKLARQPVRPFKLNPSQEVLEQDTELMRKIAAPIVERTSGVMIFATDPGMGKTTTTRDVVRQLQEKKKIAGAIYIDCEDVTQMMEEGESNKNPYLALRRRLLMDMGVPRDTHARDNFSSMFSPPKGQRVVMVLDQFELFKNLCEEKYLQNMIKSMALDASQANVHTVVVVVADKDLASAMCTWNNRQKITSLLPEDEPYEPSKEFVARVAARYRQKDERLAGMSDEAFAACFGGCRTPGDVVRARDKYVEEMTIAESRRHHELV
jgi:hypothetical protein